jgi:hypothetical protein
MKAVQRLLPGAKIDLQLYNASKEDFDYHDFVNDASMHFVREARDLFFITDTATGLDEVPLLTAHDAKEDKKKKQHIFSDTLNRYRGKHLEAIVGDLAPFSEQATFVATTGVLPALGSLEFRKILTASCPTKNLELH